MKPWTKDVEPEQQISGTKEVRLTNKCQKFTPMIALFLHDARPKINDRDVSMAFRQNVTVLRAN
jgi:hypothetical protein